MADFGEVAERLRRSTVEMQTPGQGSGSGVVWSQDGLLVTNYHVLRGPRPRVRLWDGRAFEGEVVAEDPRRDLAAVRIPASGLQSIERRDTATVRAGEIAVAVGNPLGFTGALSSGVVHGVGPLASLGAREWIQADVRLAPGNSGGPLADARGRLLGVNTMIAGGLALAIPSNRVADFMARGARPGLGVVVRPVRGGLLILEVIDGGAAARVSLLPGDLITAVAGRPASWRELDAAIERGGLLQLQFQRGGPAAREVVVGLHPERAAEAA